MAVLPSTRRPDLLEQIRRRDVARLLRKLDLSPEEEEAIERLSYSLVAKILLDLVPKVTAHAESRTTLEERGEKLAVPVDSVRHGGRKRDKQVR